MNATRVELKALSPDVSQTKVQGFLYACTDSLGLERGLSVVAYEWPGGRVAGFYLIPDAHMSVHQADGELIVELYSMVPIDTTVLENFTAEYFSLENWVMN